MTGTSRKSQGWAAARALLLLATLAVVAGVVLALDRAGASPAFVAALALYGALLAVPFLRGREEVDVFEPVLYASLMGVPVVLAPVIKILQGEFRIFFLPGLPEARLWELSATAIALTALGHACYLAGYYGFGSAAWWRGGRTAAAPARLGMGAPPQGDGGVDDGISVRRLRIAAAGAGVVGFLSFAAYVQLNGGLRNILVFANRVALGSGLSYFIYFAQWSQFVPLILLLVDTVQGRRRLRWITWASLLGSSVLVMLFGGRGRVVVGWLFFAIAYHYLRSRLSPARLAALALVVVVFASAFLAVRRTTYFGTLPDFSRVQEAASPVSSLESFVEGRVQMDVFATLLEIIPERIDYQYGRTFLNVAFAPVPRSIWPDKPIVDESGVVGRAILGERWYGLPPGNAAHFFLNFHVPGVIVGFLLLGALHRRVYVGLAKSRLGVAAPVLYAVLLVNMETLSLSAIVALFLLAVPLWLLLRLCRRGEPRRPRGSAPPLRLAPASGPP